MSFEKVKLFELQGKGKGSVLLVSPNDSGSYRSGTFVIENLGIGYLASYLSSLGVDVTICDARFFGLTPQQAVNLIKTKNFDLIGLSVASRNGAQWCRDFCSKLRKDSYQHITAGGQFPTLETKDAFAIIDNLDSVIMGEGELSIGKLCEHLINKSDWRKEKGISYKQENGEIFISEDRDIACELDKLPFPYRYLLPYQDENSEILIEGSRGCVFWCTFCAIRPFLGKFVHDSWRIRSAENILKEIKQIMTVNPKVRNFRFIDSDFIGPLHSERAWKFAKLAQRQLKNVFMHMEGRAISIMNSEDLLLELKKAGLRRVYLGVESGSQRILDKMNKRTTVEENKRAIDVLKKLNIDFSYGFIMVTPWSEDEDITENIAMLKYIGKIQMNKFFHELFLIRGTVAYDMVKKDGVKLNELNGYYTYPSRTENIAKLRKLGSYLEYKCVPFMKRLWLLYNKVRKLNFGNSNFQELEKQLDRLYIDIFEYCWEKSKKGETEAQVVNACMKKFDPDIKDLEFKIEESASC
ncbi:MAG: B12-binding domain-containing radical SAM protein [Alphaproteobacteria bacterium]|nr:B12-binding domain-containing radical SAM protein [Alphaproteobacteria bacterium]